MRVNMNVLRALLVAGSFIAVSLGTVACTQTVILFKPKPNIDPMPETKACKEKAAAKDEDDPKFTEQWSLAQLGVTADVLKAGTLDGNANVRVAILSTGI